MNPTPSHEIPKAPRVPAGLPIVHAAKWPPDDADLPGGGAPFGGAGGGGYDDMGDGNFRKGRFKPIAVVIGMLVALGGGAALFFGLQSDANKLDAKQMAEEKKQLQILPMAEALPKWRQWAKSDGAGKLREEAFAQLAWIKDKEGLASIIDGLKSADHRIRGTAAQALLEYGSPDADAAKPALLKALAESDSSDKPQIVWALAVLKEASAFDTVLAEYRQGHLAKVQKLDGSPAFDPDLLAGMVSLDKLASLAGDESESVRQLVATVLSRANEPKWTPQLTKLVTDKSTDVAREAAVGLGKIGNEESMKPLLEALARSDKDSRQKFLEALRDGVGSKGLVLALKSVQKETLDREKHQTKQLFDMMRAIQDPRGADLLAQYLDTNPKPHWRTEAAIRLAEVGDLRAVPTLAWRMRQDPLKIYDAKDDPEYRQDDNERVVASRMLADLAILHPDKRAEIRAQAEDAVLFWATDKPQPHANALRFLAAAESTNALPKMRAWANPTVALPREGQKEFPPEFATAQSALRYLGWMKDGESWGTLEKQLLRRPAKVDATMESLMQGGLAVMGMTLRAIGVGAAHGFAQWGDPKAYPTLVKFIEDKENNEQARIEACFSLAWVATDDQMAEVVKKVKENTNPDPKSQLVRACYLETLIRRPVPAATGGLVELIADPIELEVRHQAARAIGFGGMTPEIAAQLFDKLKSPSLRNDAMLAILLGGDADLARRALATYNDADPAAVEELKVIYDRTFGYWSDVNYEKGDVARWVDNAIACSRVKVRDQLQDWPRLIVSRGLSGIDYDNGPHSITRVQLRVRLMRDARSGDEAKRATAIRILKFMSEKGVLMALKSEQGPHAELARQAFFELMNPKLTTDALPEAKPASGGGAGSVKVIP